MRGQMKGANESAQKEVKKYKFLSCLVCQKISFSLSR